MQIVVGLGNPGSEYVRTRHNIGFRVVEQLAGKSNWQSHKASHSEVTELLIGSEKLLLAKPQTFMNRSGETVRQLLKQRPVELDQLWVVHDDLDLELGHYKIRKGTGPKIHNGLLSIYDCLGSKEFWHVRVGVDGRHGDRTIPAHNYVLMPFAADEEAQVAQTIEQVAQELRERIAGA